MKRDKIEKSKMLILNAVIGICLVIVNFGLTYILYSSTIFAGLSKKAFILINIVALIILLFLNLLFIIFIRSRKKVVFITLLCMTVIFTAFSGYGAVSFYRVNRNVNKIVVSNYTKETVETSIVTLKSKYTKISDLENKVIGIVSGSVNADLAKKYLTKKLSNVSYKEYTDINSLFTDLVGNEVDGAVLPSNYQGIFEVVSGYEKALESTAAIETFSEEVKTEVETSDKDITKEPFSVLILGVDEGRSDANMVVTFNPISLEITMTSIARDSYVPIACYSGQASDKLGHAHVQSTQCTIKTIENLLDIDIDYYFESNFKGVVAMVDALGGIVIKNPYELVGQNSSSERGHYTVWVPAGDNVPVNGEQALAFARERHMYVTGDFQRQANQQQVITAVIRKAMQVRDINKLLNMLDAAGDNVKTNLSVDQLISLFNYVMEKTTRFYGSSNLEQLFKIVGSRVTGYNSSVWSDAAQLALSIVRPYEGSIKDNHTAILRNLDLKSQITAPKTFSWQAASEFMPPTISSETYSEKIIQSVTPQSYWCSRTGGTWDGNACSCPFGDFVENKGCAQAAAHDYHDTASCLAAGFIWNEASKTCVSTCPKGTESDGQYCRAVKEEPTAYKDAQTCVVNGYRWDEGTQMCVVTCPSGTKNKDGICKVVQQTTTSPSPSTIPSPSPKPSPKPSSVPSPSPIPSTNPGESGTNTGGSGTGSGGTNTGESNTNNGGTTTTPGENNSSESSGTGDTNAGGSGETESHEPVVPPTSPEVETAPTVEQPVENTPTETSETIEG